MPAEIKTEPNEKLLLSIINNYPGEKRYILAPLGVKAGDTIISSDDADIIPGNSLPLSNIPVGTLIHNIELRPGAGGQHVNTTDSAVRCMMYSPSAPISAPTSTTAPRISNGPVRDAPAPSESITVRAASGWIRAATPPTIESAPPMISGLRCGQA